MMVCIIQMQHILEYSITAWDIWIAKNRKREERRKWNVLSHMELWSAPLWTYQFTEKSTTAGGLSYCRSFNGWVNWNEKQKKCYFSYEKRKQLLEAIRYVDLVIPEENWEQKRTDVKEYHVDTFVMGDDWKGKIWFPERRRMRGGISATYSGDFQLTD
mgnify:CR=1 FL=1